MSLDKFGRHSGACKRIQRPYTRPSPSLPRTLDGDIDMQNLKICNLKLPSEKSDAVTKDYVDAQLKDMVASEHILIRDNQTKIGHLKSKNELLENDIEYKLKSKIVDLTEKYRDASQKISALEEQCKNHLTKILALEEQHKLFNITATYISIGKKRIVSAGNAINDGDLVPKGQLIQIIDDKMKAFIPKSDTGKKPPEMKINTVKSSKH